MSLLDDNLIVVNYFCYQVNMSVAIVMMVNNTEVSLLHQSSGENHSEITELACPLLEDSSSDQTDIAQVSSKRQP